LVLFTERHLGGQIKHGGKGKTREMCGIDQSLLGCDAVPLGE